MRWLRFSLTFFFFKCSPQAEPPNALIPSSFFYITNIGSCLQHFKGYNVKNEIFLYIFNDLQTVVYWFAVTKHITSIWAALSLEKIRNIMTPTCNKICYVQKCTRPFSAIIYCFLVLIFFSNPEQCPTVGSKIVNPSALASSDCTHCRSLICSSLSVI